MLQSLFGRKREPSAGSVGQLTVAELQRKLAAHESIQLIDVRSPEEFRQSGHVAGARLIPLPALAQRLVEIDRALPVALICQSGNRSRAAAELLVREGYTDVSNVQGGMLAWRLAGLPTH